MTLARCPICDIERAVDKASKARVDAKLAKVLAEGERLIKGCKR